MDIEQINNRFGEHDVKDITPKILIEFHQNIQRENDLSFTAKEHLRWVLCAVFKVVMVHKFMVINPAFRTFRHEKKVFLTNLL